MLEEEILIEIDSTLDQLLLNAETMKEASICNLKEEEIEGFYKTQESLIEHLLYLDESFSQKHSSLKEINKKSANLQLQKKILKLEKIHNKDFYIKRKSNKTINL